MKKIVKAFLFPVLFISLIGVVFPVLAQVRPIGNSNSEEGCDRLGVYCDKSANAATLKTGIMSLVNIGLGFVGLLAAIFVVIGGVRYIISQGEDDETEKAKKTILYAVIGLIIIGLSAAIVNFFLGPPK